jgi:hypothetical protein
MTTAYTTLLGFAQPQTGDLSGTWGAVVNSSVTQLVEDAIAGVATETVASTDWTLTTTGSGADNQARKAILIPTGSSGTTRYINAPKTSKAYVVINNSTGSVVIRGGPTSPTTGATVLAGATATVAWNGSDFVNITPAYKNIPQSGSDKTTSYSLSRADVGMYIGVGSGGSISVPDATFVNGDVISIFNNTASSVTLTMTITTAYIGGANTDKATINLDTRGIATILFISPTVCVVTGNVS